MLEFSGSVSLAGNIRYFLELQAAFEAGDIIHMSAHKINGARVCHSLYEFFCACPHTVEVYRRRLAQYFFGDILIIAVTQKIGKNHHDGNLSVVCFSRRHGDFHSCAYGQADVAFRGKITCHNVGYAKRLSASFFRHPYGVERIRRFARLTYEHA